MNNFYNSIPVAGSVCALTYLFTDILIVGYLSGATFLFFLGVTFIFLLDCLFKFGWHFSVEAEIHVGQIMGLFFYLLLMALIVVTGF